MALRPCSSMPTATDRSSASLLRADAGDEDGHVGAEVADAFELVGVGGADDEADVAVVVPFDRSHGDVFVHRANVAAGHGGDEEVLELAGAGVGGAAEDKDAAVRAGEEGREGVPAHVGVEGCGVKVPHVKQRSCVTGRGVVEVTALGVADDGNPVGDGVQGRSKGLKAGYAELPRRRPCWACRRRPSRTVASMMARLNSATSATGMRAGSGSRPTQRRLRLRSAAARSLSAKAGMGPPEGWGLGADMSIAEPLGAHCLLRSQNLGHYIFFQRFQVCEAAEAEMTSYSLHLRVFVNEECSRLA